MIGLVFIGIILDYLGLLHGWLLFWYVLSLVIVFCANIISVIKDLYNEGD